MANFARKPRHSKQLQPGQLPALNQVSVGRALLPIIIASDKYFALLFTSTHLRGLAAAESAGLEHSSFAAGRGCRLGFIECAWTRLSDGASLAGLDTVAPCTYCQCWEESNWPKKQASHRWAVYFALRFDGFTSTE